MTHSSKKHNDIFEKEFIRDMFDKGWIDRYATGLSKRKVFVDGIGTSLHKKVLWDYINQLTNNAYPRY